MNKSKYVVLLLIILLTTLFFVFDLQQYLSLEFLKQQQLAIVNYWHKTPFLTLFGYFLIYTVITALSLPGATILTLAGGSLFGLVWGTLIVSFASTLGATLAFLAARFLLRDFVQSRFAERMTAINRGIRQEGIFYLLTLRLVPIFPFFIINLTMGLTRLRLWSFYWVSQLGMLPGTLVYVNAGTQLAKINTLSDIMSPTILGSLLALGLFPLLANRLIEMIKKAQIYKPWKRPQQFDNNLLVIGAGSAGLVTAYIASAVKAKVTLVEKHKMGGDCLNTGCIPSKALIRSAQYLNQIKRSKQFGIRQAHVEYDFADIMQRIQTVIQTIEPHDSIERYRQLGVTVIAGEAKIISPWQVEVKTPTGVSTITTRSIIIAAGAHPFIPPIPGIEQVSPLTSDNIWQLKTLPERLLVLGGGPIGCELAQSFARLGSQVTQIEMLARLMMREDCEVSEQVMKQFCDEGIDVKVECTAKAFLQQNGQKILIAEHQGKQVRIEFDQVLIAIGRSANISGYGIEQLNIRLTPQKTIETNGFQATNYPNIYACGDVTGPYQFTHTAAHQAWYATVNALFGQFRKFQTDYSVIPWSIFTDPEVARVGLNEQEAIQQNIAYDVSCYRLNDLDRAITDGEAYGFIKVLTRPNKDKILGVTIVGKHAGELIAEFVLAMKHGIGLNKILSTIHIYPTLTEANKYVAGVWKKQQTPQWILKVLERYQTWQR